MDAFENPAAQVFSTTDYFTVENINIDFYQAAALAVIPLDILKAAARKSLKLLRPMTRA